MMQRHDTGAGTPGGRLFTLEDDEIFDVLGHTTYDVYLNAIAYWRNIPW
jgi:hypothetical protein